MTLAPPQRLLLIDDDPAGAELTVAALRAVDASVEIEVLADGEEALDYVFRRGPYAARPATEPDALLLDLKMPKVDGHEVLRQIRQHPDTGRLKVVVLTSSDQSADLTLSQELGSDDYLVKPASIIDLIEQLRRCRALGLAAS